MLTLYYFYLNIKFQSFTKDLLFVNIYILHRISTFSEIRLWSLYSKNSDVRDQFFVIFKTHIYR